MDLQKQAQGEDNSKVSSTRALTGKQDAGAPCCLFRKIYQSKQMGFIWGDFAPQETSKNTWRHVWLSQLKKRLIGI